MTAALRTEGLSKHFGAFKAVSDVTLAFPHGARHALIGPNGAGKTTLINLLTGVLPPTSGEVMLGDERITALPQHERVKRGMTRTFQINTLFPGLTVLESVVLAVAERRGRAGRWFSTVASLREETDEAHGAARVAAPRRRRPTRSRATCPTASSGWSRSRSRSPRARASCCSTSRPPASRRGRAPSSSA